jgi:UDP-glucose 4-epimerase
MTRKKLIITWGLGYIWSHATLEAIKQWLDVLIIDNCYNSEVSVLDNIVKAASSKDFWVWHKNFEINFLRKSINDLTVEDLHWDNFVWCINFAWMKAVWESCSMPFEYYDNNVWWMIHLLNVLEKKWIKNFIFYR